MGFVLDDTKALAMPKICNVPIDPNCGIYFSLLVTLLFIRLFNVD